MGKDTSQPQNSKGCPSGYIMAKKEEKKGISVDKQQIQARMKKIKLI